ncbi:MAG: hypothetical protein ACD_22C00253G0012 [uncultured bacterium]|nr:MAG: hypothetical protein ACD_22C00253G0012 [uncultured bacterium]
MKKLIFILLFVILTLSGFFVVRILFSGNEDTWVCENGSWVKHGNPDSRAPTTVCGKKKTARPGEFSNGQIYEIFETDDFEIKYPKWPNIDKKLVAEPEKVEVAVTNEGCAFVITSQTVPSNLTYKDFMEKQLVDQQAALQYPTTIVNKKIEEATAQLESEISIGTSKVKSVSYGYMSSTRQSYGIGFVAEKSVFDTGCKSLINDVIDSIVVK